MKHIFSFLLAILSFTSFAEDLSLSNHFPKDHSSGWSQSLGSSGMHPYYNHHKETQTHIDRENSGKLEGSLCIPNYPCNFLKGSAVDSLRHDARQESKIEIDGYKNKLLNTVLDKAEDLTRDQRTKRDSIQNSINQEVQAHTQSFSRIDPLKFYTEISPDFFQGDVSSVGEIIKQENEEAIGEWLEESTTYFTEDHKIPDDLLAQMESYPYRTPIRTVEGQKLLKLNSFAQTVRGQLKKEDTHYSEKSSLVQEAETTLNIADDYFVENDHESANFAISLAQELLDLAVSFIPQLWTMSLGKSAYEAITGQELLTSEYLDPLARVGAVIDLATLGLGSKFVKASKIVQKISARGGRAALALEQQVGDLFEYARKNVVGLSHAKLDSRRKAFNLAKKDAGIPRSAQPTQVKKVAMTDKYDKIQFDKDHQPLQTLEYHYKRNDGKTVVIQDHRAGHQFGDGGKGDQGAHFNVRPLDTKTGNGARNDIFEGAKDHYFFEGP
jgi:hypothetical protein